MKKIIVVGGGAAGMMAAIQAAQAGAQVTILEKMPRVGKKMLITGKGRCNITNCAPIPELIQNMIGNGAFLYSAFHQFDNQEVIRFFGSLGVEVKTERGGRVFPVSDKAADVVKALQTKLESLDVTVLTNHAVDECLVCDGRISGVKTTTGTYYAADAVIVAVGGASYPATGSSGDGVRLAGRLGHTIVPLRPSLVPLETEEDWVRDVQGLSLRNVKVTLSGAGKKLEEEFGEMLFTHFGVSGPIILSLSRKAALALEKSDDVVLAIDLKPALSLEKLDKRIQRDFTEQNRRQLRNVLPKLLPVRLVDIVLDLAFLDGDKQVSQVTREERLRLMEVLKCLELTITKTRSVDEAIVTAGGVAVKEINPKTMESKRIQGLYFAGEVIDIDGYTGGFNLQAAFSTGYVAGINAAVGV